MPIREWTEHIQIHVECSSRELPRVVAALNGQYRAASIAYEARDVESRQALPYHGNVDVPFVSQQRSSVYG